MSVFILGMVFAAIAVVAVLVRYLRRLQHFGKGLEAAVRQLAQPSMTVRVPECHPLSDHMIKELATARGLTYTGRAQTRDLGALTFKPRQNP